MKKETVAIVHYISLNPNVLANMLFSVEICDKLWAVEWEAWARALKHICAHEGNPESRRYYIPCMRMNFI